MSTPSTKDGGKQQVARLGRREALARLGLGATVAYAAPVLLTLSQARATEHSGASGSSDGPSGTSAASGPSTASVSAGSGPSTASASAGSGPSTAGASAGSGASGPSELILPIGE